jgi:hypothetical protein
MGPLPAWCPVDHRILINNGESRYVAVKCWRGPVRSPIPEVGLENCEGKKR